MSWSVGHSEHGQRAGRCWECGGACLTYKGSKHGWRCTGCLNAYLDTAWARALASKYNSAAIGEGRGGGGLATGRTAATTNNTGQDRKATR